MLLLRALLIATLASPCLAEAQLGASAAMGGALDPEVRGDGGIFYRFSVGFQRDRCRCALDVEWLNATVPTASGGRELGVGAKYFFVRQATAIEPYAVMGLGAFGLRHRTIYGYNAGVGAQMRGQMLGIFAEARLQSQRDMSAFVVGGIISKKN